MNNQRLGHADLRRRFALLVWAASMLMVSCTARNAVAQEGEGRYVAQASKRLNKLVDAYIRDGYRFADDRFSIAGGWVRQGRENWVSLCTIPLKQGKDYCVLAVGDLDAQDVDVRVIDAAGKKVAYDESTEIDAVVKHFRPTRPAKYQIQVRVYDSRDNLPCVCLAAVMEKPDPESGARPDRADQGKHVTEAAQRLIRLLANANGAGYRLSSNQLSIGGAWVRPKKETWVSVGTTRLEKGKDYRVLVAGDDDVRDVNVTLVDPKGGNVAFGQAADIDAIIKSFRPPETQDYTIRIRLVKSLDNKLPCVCLAVVTAKLATGIVLAQVGQGTYVTQASQHLADLVAKANQDGYRLAANRLSIAGSWVRQGRDIWVSFSTISLKEGSDYRVLAAGDNDARDVDVRVVDSTNKVVASDTTTGVTADVSFRPPRTEEKYQVEVRLYASSNNVPCACFAVVMKKPGSGSKTEQQCMEGKYITQASRRLVDLITKANGDGYLLTTDRSSTGGAFVSQSKENWVALGTLRLEQGKDYRVLASGDDDARHVGVRVVDSKGIPVEFNEKGIANAAVKDLRPLRTEDCQIQVRLSESRDNLPCVCLAAVVAKKEKR